MQNNMCKIAEHTKSRHSTNHLLMSAQFKHWSVEMNPFFPGPNVLEVF